MVSRYRACPVPACLGAVYAVLAALVCHLIGLPRGASDDIDLVTFHRAASGGRRLLGDHAVAPLTRHLVEIRRLEIEFFGHVRLREV